MSYRHNSNGVDTSANDTEHITPDTKANKIPTSTHKKSLCHSIKEIYYDYCSNTTIHGVQYLGQQRPWKEIIFWICIFIVSMYFCVTTIMKIYSKWEDTPVIVSFSEQATPIWRIPFPALTICSETKRPMDKTKPSFNELLNELSKTGSNFKPNITSTDLEEFLTLLHVCDFGETLQKSYTHQGIDYVEVLNDMLSSIGDDGIIDGTWSGRKAEKEELFTKTYTEDGICFTFNGLNGSDLYRENTVQYRQMGLENYANDSKILNRTLSWSMANGYDGNSPLRTYPARTLKAGSKAGLTVYLINIKEFHDYGCSPLSQGYKIILHPPHNVPLVSKEYIRLPVNKEVMIAVKPNMMTTSDGISEYKPEKRQCYMNNERQLKFFKIYSDNNCELECLTNFTLKDCGCVKFSMPRTPDMPVCGADKITCYQDAENKLLEKDFLEISKNINNAHGVETECNCMPACTSIEYDLEISQGDIDTENFIKALEPDVYQDHLEQDVSLGISYLSIYFKDNEFITSKRSELYGLSDFIANCGGILGLFMGFSILSVVEIVYYLTLRLWSNIGYKK